MGSLNDDDNTHSNITVLFSDEEGKQPIIWDKNTASINGTLAIVGRAIRTQLPKIYKLVTTGTVEDRGITYIDNPAKIDFLENATISSVKAFNPKYTFEKPCPPTEIEALEAGLVEALSVLRVGTDEAHRTTLQSITLTVLSTPAGAQLWACLLEEAERTIQSVAAIVAAVVGAASAIASAHLASGVFSSFS